MDSELIKIIGEKKYPLLALLNQCDRIEEIPQIILNSYKWKKNIISILPRRQIFKWKEI